MYKRQLSESELLKYIIGTLSPLEQPKSARNKGMTAFSRYKQGLTSEDIRRLKEEILSADAQSLNNLADAYQALLENRSVAVIGNKTQIDKEKDLFDAVYELY